MTSLEQTVGLSKGEYRDWIKLTEQQQKDYARLRSWGWSHEDSVIMAVDPYDD